MIIYNDRKWPHINLLLNGIINEFMYKTAKNTLNDIIKKCENENEKCILTVDMTNIDDYENYYLYCILSYISDINDSLIKNISMLNLIANESLKAILDNILYIYPPSVKYRIEYINGE